MSKKGSRSFLTAEEAADLFGVTGRTIGRWIDTGFLPGYRLPGPRGGRRIRKSQIREFVTKNPQYGFVLELLDGHQGESDSALSVTGGPEAESLGEDRSEDAGWSEASADDPSLADAV